MKTFHKGDHVHWTSQAGGVHVKKKGIIVEVVPAGTMTKVRDRDGAKSRNHESYIVEVTGLTKKSKPRRYWPIVSALKLSEAAIMPTIDASMQVADAPHVDPSIAP